MTHLYQLSKPLVRILRVEYLPGLMIGSFAVLILWFGTFGDPDFLAVLVAFLFAATLYASGFLANSLEDSVYERQYKNEKKEVAEAVFRLGKDRTTFLFLLTVILALIIGIGLSWIVASPWPLFFGILGAVTGLGYSLPPFRWKERSFYWHAFSLILSGYFLPYLLILTVLAGGFSPALLVLSLGVSLAHYGLEIGNVLKDAEEDHQREVNIIPGGSYRWAGVWGLGLILLGLAMEVWVLRQTFELPGWLVMMTVASLAAVFTRPILAYAKSVWVPQEAPLFFRTLNYTRWQTRAMLGSLIIALLIRGWLFLG